MRLQTQRAQGARAGCGLPPIVRPDLGDLEPSPSAHLDCPAALGPQQARAGATSSSGRPRRAATSSGRSRLLQRRDGGVHDVDRVGRAERLAQHVVDAGALEHGAHRATGDDTGTGAAGRSRTTPAAVSPWTGCGMVPWIRGTLKKFFLASSTPLAIAAGTSLALP